MSNTTTSGTPSNSTAASPASSGGAPGGGSGQDSEIGEMLTLTITYQINILIFSLIGLLILLRLPHLFGFLRSKSGRPVLQTLSGSSSPSSRRGGQTASRTRSNTNPSSSEGIRITNQASWIKFHGSDTIEAPHASLEIYRGPEKIRFHDIDLEERGIGGDSKVGGDISHRTSTNDVPPRITSVPTFLEPLATLMRSRVLFPGYSALQIAVMMNYTYILLYGAFRMSNPFTDNTRTAWLSVSQLPLIFALGQKSNILGSLLGYGYETLNYIHRYAGRLSVLAGNIHSIYYLFKWLNAGTFATSIARPRNAWGLVLLVAMDLLFFFSLDFWRRKAYNVFWWSHTIGIIILFPSACLHRPALKPYAYACIALYLTDRLIRALKSRITTASISSMGPHLSMACIKIPQLSSGWRAGQHVRLRALSSGMGALGWTESHPFTIASASGSEDGLVLLCKQAGDWTGRLVELAKTLEGPRDHEGETVKNDDAKIRVWIEGPFGGPMRMVFASYSAAVLVVGGSGITFGLSMVEELISKALRNESRLSYVELVWVVPDPSAIKPLITVLTSLFNKSAPAFTLRISMHYTRAQSQQPALFDDGEAALPPYTPIAINHPNITLSPGRPNLKNALNDAICNVTGGRRDPTFTFKKPRGASHHRSKSGGLGGGLGGESGPQHRACGLAVGICGPVSLGENVVHAVSEIDGATRYRVGGVEVHEE